MILIEVKSTNLEKQIDQLRSVIWALEEDQVTVIQASAEHHLFILQRRSSHRRQNRQQLADKLKKRNRQ